jgi:glycosyltransferase involved in cell wall biosynthesis
MAATDTLPAHPAVSVIIPARNEEACLEACLQSLVSQRGAAFEVIVVDDHSTDRTREIAASFSNQEIEKVTVSVRVIEAGSLPAGWTGKNNAVVAGSRVARGDWLLFTDADTIHLPGSLARSLEEATRRGAALLSYSPEQTVKGFWEKAVMPVIFGELAAGYRPAQVSNSNSVAAAANGQYILIAREAYDAVGGHAAIAASLLEDVALARAVKRSGRKIFFRYGSDAVRTRMYRNFAQLREGWSKNLVLLFSSPVRLAALRAIEFVLIIASLALGAASAFRGHMQPATLALMIFAVVYFLFATRIRRAHFHWEANILALFGLPLFSYLLLRSRKVHKTGNIPWKGRNYEDEPEYQLATNH